MLDAWDYKTLEIFRRFNFDAKDVKSITLVQANAKQRRDSVVNPKYRSDLKIVMSSL